MLIGLIGAPNQGKSTLFNALTLGNAEVANHPFTTIKPNEGIAYVRTKSLRSDESPRTGYSKGGYRFTPIRIIDVAGLVPGASNGRGLGNRFLNDLVRADALIIVVDASGLTDEEGNRVVNHNPMRNAEFIINEINEWFYKIISNQWEIIKKKTNSINELINRLSGIGIKPEHIKESIHLINDLRAFSNKLRELSKPFIIAGNKADIKFSESLKGKAYPISAINELVLRKADNKGLINYVPGNNSFTINGKLTSEQEKWLNKVKMFGNTGVQGLINKVVFDLLKQIIVYPVQNEHKWCDSKGRVLPDAYLMNSNSRVIDLAFKVHEDIGNNFIKAVNCKTHKILGKDYVLKMNDVIRIISK